MNKFAKPRRSSATNAAGLLRVQARSERRRRTSFWQFYRAEEAALSRTAVEAPSTEPSGR